MVGKGIKLDVGLNFTKLPGKGPLEPNKLREIQCDSMDIPDGTREVDPGYTHVLLCPQAISLPCTRAGRRTSPRGFAQALIYVKCSSFSPSALLFFWLAKELVLQETHTSHAYTWAG